MKWNMKATSWWKKRQRGLRCCKTDWSWLIHGNRIGAAGASNCSTACLRGTPGTLNSMGFAIAAAFIHCVQNIPRSVDLGNPATLEGTRTHKSYKDHKIQILQVAQGACRKIVGPPVVSFSILASGVQNGKNPSIFYFPISSTFNWDHEKFIFRIPIVDLTCFDSSAIFDSNIPALASQWWQNIGHFGRKSWPCRPPNAPTVRRPKPQAGKLKLQAPKECASRPGRSVNSTGTLAPAFGHFSFQRPSTTSMASWSCIRDDWWFQGPAFGKTFGTCRMGFQSVHAGVRPLCLWPGSAARR